MAGASTEVATMAMSGLQFRPEQSRPSSVTARQRGGLFGAE